MKVRTRFEVFSQNPNVVADLRRLYKSPDDVDFVLGVQLDEEYFPGTTVPRSALIVSLFSLFGMGNSDRFSVGFAMMRCLLVDKPWDCHPSNALEDLLWARKEVENFPDFRFYDKFWLTELDLQAHGVNLLWRLITENTEIKWVQQQPLFPADPNTNPILCALPKTKQDYGYLGLTMVEFLIALIKQHYIEIIIVLLIATVIAALLWRRNEAGSPPTLWGWPILGNALAFQKDPRALLLEGFHRFRPSLSGSIGIRLALLTHYVLTKPENLELMKHDNPFEVKFNSHAFLQAINMSIITKKENFDSNIHTQLIRQHLSDPGTVAAFSNTVEEAAQLYLRLHPLATNNNTDKRYDGLNDYFSHYIAFIISRCVIGDVGFDDKKLLETFEKFNDDAVAAMEVSSLLPKFLQFLAAFKINKVFKTIRTILVPIITAKRSSSPDPEKPSVFIDFIMDVIDNNDRVAGERSLPPASISTLLTLCATDIVAIVVWAGLINLQSTFTSTILDIINQPGLQDTILSSLSSATTNNLDAFASNSPEWGLLRSATFESIRLSGPIIGPARICLENVRLRSDPCLSLPKGQVATLSAYYIHRQPSSWGQDAARYNHERFLSGDPPIGEPSFVTWGLKGPHMCPGRWFALQTIQIMVKVLLETYEFKQDRVPSDEEKYSYSAGNVYRKQVGIAVRRR